MVVITILSIVGLATYLPYAHHQKKVLVKQGVKEVVQSLTEARNLAINGINSWSWNLNVALLFWSGAQQMEYYTLAHTWSFISSDLHPQAQLYKIKKLPPGVQFNNVSVSRDDVLFAFDAISGSGTILQRDGIIEPKPETILIDVSYKWARSPVLQKQIEYYTRSYISDY